MIKATIPTFEELTDSDGKIYTVYNVFVEEKKTSMRWLLRKRYSAFQALHAALKDQYADIVEPFRFPHKSMFNTFSNYTKERRRQGFDEFLKILVTLDPLPVEVAKFLELNDHVWSHAASLPQNGKAVVSDGNSEGTPTAAASGSAAPSASSTGDGNSGALKKSHHQSSQARHSTPVQANITSKDLLKTLRTTFIATSTIYVACVSFGIIDTSLSSPSQMGLTMLLLGSVFTLIRIILLKREYNLAAANSGGSN